MDDKRSATALAPPIFAPELREQSTRGGALCEGKQFRSMIDGTPGMIWMAGIDMRRNFFNSGWLEFTGHTREESVNGWAKGVHPEDLQRCLDVYTAAFEAHRSFSMEYRLRRRGGEYSWILDRGVAHYTPDGAFAGYIGSAHDITEQRQAQAALEHALAFERLIADLSTTFVDLPASSIDAHIISGLEKICRFLDIDRSSVVQSAASDLEVTHHWVRESRPEWRMPTLKRPRATLPWLEEQFVRGETVTYSQIDELPPEAAREREFAERHGPKSYVGLPLIVGGQIIGSLNFGTMRAEREWGHKVPKQLQLVAQLIGNALDRKRADLELRAALADNERLRQRLDAENVYPKEEVTGELEFDEIVGRSQTIRAVLHKVDQVAATDVPVLLLGETGTGKELIARAIHARSGRRGGSLIAVNCAALPPTLIESELFGHEKGAFTGATQARPGRFELADGSTLFLDEIGDLEPALQSKLLRALQEGEIQRLGALRTRKVDVRVVAATNRDLQSAMREGRFRADLYYRLGVFPIELPPLRDRREDIPLLVWHFLEARQRALGRQIEEIPSAAMDALVAYDWPGNVRELQNVIDRALILSNGPILRVEEAFGVARASRTARDGSTTDSLSDTERTHIISVLERCRWVIEGRGQTAARLGVRPSTLRNRMKKLGIGRPAAAR